MSQPSENSKIETLRIEISLSTFLYQMHLSSLL